eukprot:3200964-Pyramimonas_sp.AAC.1
MPSSAFLTPLTCFGAHRELRRSPQWQRPHACVPQPTLAHPAHVSGFPSALSRAPSVLRRAAYDEK